MIRDEITVGNQSPVWISFVKWFLLRYFTLSRYYWISVWRIPCCFPLVDVPPFRKYRKPSRCCFERVLMHHLVESKNGLCHMETSTSHTLPFNFFLDHDFFSWTSILLEGGVYHELLGRGLPKSPHSSASAPSSFFVTTPLPSKKRTLSRQAALSNTAQSPFSPHTKSSFSPKLHACWIFCSVIQDMSKNSRTSDETAK